MLRSAGTGIVLPDSIAPQPGIPRLLIAPHHGTHWSASMPEFRAHVALSSVGEKLFKHSRPEYKTIAGEHLITYLQGHIGIPSVVAPDRF